jgi:hypothetical protein
MRPFFRRAEPRGAAAHVAAIRSAYLAALPAAAAAPVGAPAVR